MRLRALEIAGLILATSAAAVLARPVYPTQSLNRVQVLALMDFGESSQRVIQLIRRAGIAFQPTADDLKVFKGLGASPALLDSLGRARPAAPRPAANPEEQAAFAHLSSCMTLARNGDIAGAQKECEAATSYEPGITYFALGNVSLRAGQIKEAVAAFKAAERADSDNPDTRNYEGLALGRSGKMKDARKEFETAIRLDPDFDTPHNNLAGFYLQKNDLDGAKSELLEALRINPDSPSAHGNLGVVLARQSNLTDAIAELRKAVALDPREFRYGSLAMALTAAKDYAGAVAAYRSALQLNPRWVEGHVKLAALLLLLRRPDEATGECQAAGQDAPGNSTVRKLCEQIDRAAASLRGQGPPAGISSPAAAPRVVATIGQLPAVSSGAGGNLEKELQAVSFADFPALYDKARGGDAKSQAMVCIAYREGHFVKQDDATGFDWCRKAAEQNNVAGEEDVGVQYAYGRGVQPNSSLGVEWLEKAAARNEDAVIADFHPHR